MMTDGAALSSTEMLCNICDITACVFLTVIILVTAAHRRKDAPITHFLNGSLMLLTGILIRVMVRAYEAYASAALTGAASSYPAVSFFETMSFVFMFCSVSEFFSETVLMNQKNVSRREYRVFLRCNVAMLAAGFALYVVIGHALVWALMGVVQIVFGAAFCLRGGYILFSKATFLVATGLPVLSFVIVLIWPQIKLTGLGLALLYIISDMEYHMNVEKVLMRREVELANSRIKLLTGQISPHFIFNSLQTIQGLCDVEPGEVKPALSMFSSYLRGNLESLTEDKLIPFERELEHTRAYLTLERLGAGRGFDVEYRLGTTNFMVPPLTLQPIVENAVRYGIGTRAQGDRVLIETIDGLDSVTIRVTDNGHGQDSATPQQKTRKSVGLDNVSTRLRAQCEGTLDMQKTDQGTVVTIKIPKKI